MFRSKLKIAILDDHAIFLDGLKAILNQESSVEIVCAATNWTDFKLRSNKKKIDIAILDIHLSQDPDKENGFDIADYLMDVRPEIKCLMLSFSADPTEIEKAKNLSVSGYLLKEESTKELLEAIKYITKTGKSYFSRSVIQKWLTQKEKANHPKLTPTEEKVLCYIARGHNVPQIEDLTDGNRNVIRTHKKHIMQKLDIHNVEHLVVWAREKGYHERPLD